MIVTAAGATVEYDCARGTIDEPLLAGDKGDFEALGTHAFERGGPIRFGGNRRPSSNLPGFAVGRNGRQLHLSVTLLKSGEVVGAFLLGLGRLAQIEKCL